MKLNSQLVQRLTQGLLIAGLTLSAPLALAADNSMNMPAISMFFAFVVMTLGITYWAAKRTQSTSDFYTAGGGITGWQNGLAIAGDYMSAATLLGLTAMLYTSGVDAYIYMIAFFVGWPIILFLMAERLRNLGRFTFVDITSYRLNQSKIRTMAAISSLIVVCFYLVAQMVGAGQLIKLLFGLDYNIALFIVGILMMVYVTFGGMTATTWVQIIKACMLLAGGTLVMLLSMAYFDFSFERVMDEAISLHSLKERLVYPGSLLADPVTAISLGLGLMFGTAGLPHILMRFFTVGNAKEARKSVLWASACVAYFFNVIALMGVAAIVIVGQNPDFFEGGDIAGKIIGGGNMVAMHLAQAVGGNMLLGFLSAVAFATILAVVAGLALAGASAIAHDLYAQVLKKGQVSEQQELKMTRLATISLGVVAIILGIAFENMNVAFMAALAFGVAASANFPVLILSMYWNNLTTRGAMAGGYSGLFSSVIFVVLSKSVWVDVFGFAEAVFPYTQPALFSMPIAFAMAYLVSITDHSSAAQRERAAFADQYVRAQTGVGASANTAH
ncbi:acetate permease [Thiopseudomonas alkaliphila]|uniref:cation acetate symporter n=1 Tax=Thiopseudomonas alkaliphila TaxID=1697053 RepID=UPI00069EDE0D|nr:cation acetate symporter [Thiopseudomonas alkaliphila]AKX44605.1 acetate permease [Thiopseudomonas alkaliphila]AKX47801.1 acetate permease [Thiopseudomonas alkaliphila]AKX47987.1 acetate permease [Thiopseudomonas alkaliphila]AKX53123.1 acetate permease [Thiopseudomonas alkaliphila]